MVVASRAGIMLAALLSAGLHGAAHADVYDDLHAKWIARPASAPPLAPDDPDVAMQQAATAAAPLAALDALDWLVANACTATGTGYDNWYDWQIGTPQVLNNLVMSWYADLAPAQVANVCAAIDHYIFFGHFKLDDAAADLLSDETLQVGCVARSAA